MGQLRGKTWINIAATLLVVLVVFILSSSFVLAQTGTGDNPGNPNAPTLVASPQVNTVPADKGKVVGFDTGGKFVYDGLTSIGGLVLALGGKILDVSLSWFVYGMKDTLDTLKITPVIGQIWALVRDLFNLLFIFGLIFIGFKIILDIDDSGSKKTLVTLITAALLINFSLYVTQVVIDFSNIASAEIGQLLITSESERSTVFGMKISNVSSGFIAATDLNSLASTTLSKVNELSTGKTISLPTTGLGVGHALAMGLTIALMLILIGFVFAAGAIIMFTRFMYLIFLMMFSPIMFLGWVLPGFSSRSKNWWNTLFTQAFVGPAYLFMLYVALVALQSLMNSGVTSGDTSIIAFVMSSLIVSAFVWAALLVAQKMGAAGADMAVNTGQRWGKSVRGGITSFAGRNTVGRFADLTLKQLDRDAATGSQSRAAKAFRSVLDNRTVRSSLEAAKKSKFSGSYSLEDDKKYSEEKNKRITADRAAINRERDLDRGILATDSKASTPPDSATMKSLAAAMKDLTEKQLTEDLDVKVLTNQNIAVHLSEKNIETLEKSGKRSEADMKAIKAARKQGLIDIARNGTDEHGVPLTGPTAYNPERNAEWLATKGTDEVAKMPVEVFTSPAMAPYLTPAMVEAKMKSGLSNTDIEAIRQKIDGQIGLYRMGPGTPATNAYVKQWKTWSDRTSVGARLGLQNLP